eukprot:Nk52_evm20s239 gene=Nk52_evmTU20s239
MMSASKRLLSTNGAKFVSIDPATCKVGWIGTGVMGRHMCEHLMKRGGYTNVSVYTRTVKKAQPLVDLGAKLKNSAREVAENSDIVFTMVGYPADVERVMLGESGLLSGMSDKQIVVDFTTSMPSLAETLCAKGLEKGVAVLDAPVSGGDIGARNGTLSIMVGGDEMALNHIMPMLDCFGKNINYTGVAGNGQHTKMTNQITIATCMIGVCEALMYAQKAGLDLEKTLQAIGGGAAASFSLTSYAPRILKRDFAPGFYVHHFVKDLEIALDECRRYNLALPGLALAHQLYVALKAQGNGDLGTQSLILALEKLNGKH